MNHVPPDWLTSISLLGGVINTILKINQQQGQCLTSYNYHYGASLKSPCQCHQYTFQLSGLSMWAHLTQPLSLTALDSYNTAAYSELIKSALEYSSALSLPGALHLSWYIGEPQEVDLQSETEKNKVGKRRCFFRNKKEFPGESKQLIVQQKHAWLSQNYSLKESERGVNRSQENISLIKFKKLPVPVTQTKTHSLKK